MQMIAVVKGEYSEGTVPPFFCGPKQYFPFTGYYDADTNEILNESPSKNRAGRSDVSACCWWGRGSVSQISMLSSSMVYHCFTSYLTLR